MPDQSRRNKDALLGVFAAAVPTAKKEKYIKFLNENGALAVANRWSVIVPEGGTTSLSKAVKCGADETVCAGWII